MRRLFPRPNPAAASPEEDAALAPAAPTKASAIPETPAEPDRPAKPFPELPLCFMLSHVEPDGPVRLDGVKLALTELMGLELDAPKLGAFAGCSTPATSRCSCWSASTRPTWNGCETNWKRRSRSTCPSRPSRRPARSGAS